MTSEQGHIRDVHVGDREAVVTPPTLSPVPAVLPVQRLAVRCLQEFSPWRDDVQSLWRASTQTACPPMRACRYNPSNVGVPPFVRLSAKFCSLLWSVQELVEVYQFFLAKYFCPLMLLSAPIEPDEKLTDRSIDRSIDRSTDRCAEQAPPSARVRGGGPGAAPRHGLGPLEQTDAPGRHHGHGGEGGDQEAHGRPQGTGETERSAHPPVCG